MNRQPIIITVGISLILSLIAIALSIFAISKESNFITSKSQLTTTTSKSADKFILQNGVYSDGPIGYPHYFVIIDNVGNGTITGTVNFLYEDGQTSVVFSFNATPIEGYLNIKVNKIPQIGSASENPSNVPTVISATYSSNYIDLGECLTYLHFASSNSDCQFHK
jgi:hypothetical protein